MPSPKGREGEWSEEVLPRHLVAWAVTEEVLTMPRLARAIGLSIRTVRELVRDAGLIIPVHYRRRRRWGYPSAFHWVFYVIRLADAERVRAALMYDQLRPVHNVMVRVGADTSGLDLERFQAHRAWLDECLRRHRSRGSRPRRRSR